MRLEIGTTGDLKGLESEWLAFQGEAFGTFYQTYQWCSTWQEQVGAHKRVEPLIVTGRWRDGKLAFLLPFALSRRAGIMALEWLAMAQSSYGYGLFARDFLPIASSWFAGEGWSIINLAGRPDAIHLRDLPAQLHGYEHPLTAWFTMRGRNSAYAMALEPDYSKLYEQKRSAETRRGNRKRDAKLAAVGEVRFGLPENPAETAKLLELMFAQQRDRLAEAGIHGVFGRLERQFIQKLAELPGYMQPILLPYHLTVGGQMEAMMLGGNYGGCYWALISSLGSGEARKYSPGDAALRRTIEACCERGLAKFDFSSGDTAYKLQWSDDTTPLYDVVRGRSAKGLAWCGAQAVSLLAKRVIKRTPALWKLATALRKIRAADS